MPFVPGTRTGGRDVAEEVHGGSVHRDRAAAGRGAREITRALKWRSQDFVDRNLTNAVAEGLNEVIKIVKSRPSRCCRLLSLADMNYLIVGDFIIPGYSPSNLRAP